jgi:glycosyltransferase involved in cell wall biosynthesis
MISVVIATHRRHAILRRTLPSVLDQDLSAASYEIVVVTDGPDQETSDWLRHLRTPLQIRCIEQPHRGLAAARNTGIRESVGERLLFLDDDLICDPRLVGRHAAIRDNGSVVGFGPVLVSDESPSTIVSQWVRRSAENRRVRLSERGANWPKDIAVCANYSAPRQLLSTCGGFDESFVGACEEFDIGIRLRKLGAEFRYLSDAIAHEIYVKSARDAVRNDCIARGGNEVRLCRKHPEYRRVSVPARFNQGQPVLRTLRQVAVRAPISPEPVLSALFSTAELASGIRLVDSAANRLLEFRRGVALFRSAVRAAGSWDNFRQEFAIQLPVLRYRHITHSHAGTDSKSDISPRRFEEQMNWLAKNRYRTVTPSQWRAWCDGGAPLASRPVMLTFDEPCVCLTEHAFPVLTRHTFGAIVLLADGISERDKFENPRRCSIHGPLPEDQIREWRTRGIDFAPRTSVDVAEFGGASGHGRLERSADHVGEGSSATIASPGAESGTSRDAVRVAVGGASHAVSLSVESGLNSLGSDPTVMKRITIQPDDSLFEFSMRVRFGWGPFDRLRKLATCGAGGVSLRRTRSGVGAHNHTIG